MEKGGDNTLILVVIGLVLIYFIMQDKKERFTETPVGSDKELQLMADAFTLLMIVGNKPESISQENKRDAILISKEIVKYDKLFIKRVIQKALPYVNKSLTKIQRNNIPILAMDYVLKTIDDISKVPLEMVMSRYNSGA